MPNADAILASLSALALEHRLVAQAWHGALFVGALGWLAGWRPRQALLLGLLVLPLISAALLALAAGAWFNGIAMSGLAATLFGAAVTHDTIDRRLRHRSWLPRAVGAALLAFGWFYPHFGPQPFFPSGLYSSPVGVLPCPTLALTMGILLLGQGLGSRLAVGVVAAAGAFYGIFGMLVLDVGADAVLAVGALVLALQGWIAGARTRVPIPIR